jgi:hypothetical protein
MNSSPPFSTRHLYLAAFLLTSQFVLSRVTHDPDGRCTFEFEDAPQRKSLVADFYDGSAQVSALAYSEALRTLKEKIYPRRAA